MMFKRSSRAPPFMANSWISAAVACLALFAASADAAYMPVPWVFTDPRHDPYNPMQYIASNTLTAIAICECLFLSLIFLRGAVQEEGLDVRILRLPFSVLRFCECWEVGEARSLAVVATLRHYGNMPSHTVPTMCIE